MSLSAVVTKKSVTGNQTNINTITFSLVVKDGTVEVINQDFSCEYRKGDTAAGKVVEITNAMNKVIANYKACQVIFNSVALDNAVSAIQGGIIL